MLVRQVTLLLGATKLLGAANLKAQPHFMSFHPLGQATRCCACIAHMQNPEQQQVDISVCAIRHLTML